MTVRQDAELHLQWFHALQDTHPGFLNRGDYEAAVRLYGVLDRRVPMNVTRYLQDSQEQTVAPADGPVVSMGPI
jgi:hypothetical protein